jgi:hypothetical protein
MLRLNPGLAGRNMSGCWGYGNKVFGSYFEILASPDVDGDYWLSLISYVEVTVFSGRTELS